MSRWRILALLVAGCLAAARQDAAAGPPIPERIVSMRVRILSGERYREIRAEWEAYTKAHPKDPLGWMELARAARNTGAPCEEYVRYAEKAAQLGPNDAEAQATLGSYRWRTYCASEPRDPSAAIRLLERALQLDPTLDEPRFTLYAMLLSQGRQKEADDQLRALLDGGHFPEPLIDFAHNLLVGVEPNAILLTNGDNDTYPLLALQAARGFRKDVAVVNLSLLNLPWYREMLRDGPHRVPLPVLDEDVKGVPSHAALTGLVANLERDGWKRPIYAAVTVAFSRYPFKNTRSLEGVTCRLLRSEGEEDRITVDQLAENLDSRYRLDSATSLALDWDSWSALRPIMLNYAIAEGRLAGALAEAGETARARTLMNRALGCCAFHDAGNVARHLVKDWSEWDGKSPDWVRWNQQFRE